MKLSAMVFGTGGSAPIIVSATRNRNVKTLAKKAPQSITVDVLLAESTSRRVGSVPVAA